MKPDLARPPSHRLKRRLEAVMHASENREPSATPSRSTQALCVEESDRLPGILHVIVSEPPGEIGGSQLHIIDLAEQQLKRGKYRPLVLFTEEPGYRARLQDAGIPHAAFLPWHSLSSQRRHLARLTAANGIEIVHSHGYDADMLVSLHKRILYPHWQGLPVVMTCHGWVESTPFLRLKTAANFLCYKDADALVLCSTHQQPRVAGFGGLRHYIPNGIRLDTAKGNGAAFRCKYGVPKEHLCVGVVGRLAIEKRVDLFVEAASRICKRRDDVSFLIVGSGPEEAALRQLSRELGIESRATFTGLQEDIFSVYAALDVMMLCSETETTSRVTLEALASGVSVVATEVGGIPDIITHEANGMLTEPGNSHALAECTLMLLGDPALRQRLAAAGQDTVSSHYTIERMCERTEDIYDQLLA